MHERIKVKNTIRFDKKILYQFTIVVNVDKDLNRKKLKATAIKYTTLQTIGFFQSLFIVNFHNNLSCMKDVITRHQDISMFKINKKLIIYLVMRHKKF